MQGFLRYYGRVFKDAITHSWAVADLCWAALGAILAIVVHFVPGERAVVEQLAWQIPVWVVAAVVGFRLFLAPFWIYLSQAREIASLKEKLTAQIRIYVDETDKGVVRMPTEIKDRFPPERGPDSKWVQCVISCGSAIPLTNCEVWLTSVTSLDEPSAPDLIQEELRCGWSQRDISERTLTIYPGRKQRVCFFVFYEGIRLVRPWVDPVTPSLNEGIQEPGRYRLRVLAAADEVPSASASFIFEWRDFNNITLVQEPEKLGSQG